MASSSSLSVLSSGTPRENGLSRKSSIVPRRSVATPSQILRQKQKTIMDMAERQSKRDKKSFGAMFEPMSASTPIRTQRKRVSIYDELSGADRPANELIDSVSEARPSDQHDTQTYNRNTSTPKNKTNRTLTQANQTVDSDPTLVPATQHGQIDDSVIPETQDDQMPETQEERIPETQESHTQDYSVADPVHAQVNKFDLPF